MTPGTENVTESVVILIQIIRLKINLELFSKYDICNTDTLLNYLRSDHEQILGIVKTQFEFTL